MPAPVRIGSVVRPPWRDAGDDADMTGSVTHVRRGQVEVIWHANGTVTQQGDESRFPLAVFDDASLVVSF